MTPVGAPTVQAPELTAAIGGRGLTLARRGFLAGVGGVVFAFSLPAVPRARAAVAAAAPAGPSSIGAWIAIDAAGVTTIQVGSSEMGQGVLTSLAQIVAEELCVDWPAVRAQHSPASTTYGNPAYGGQQVTGGSYSVRGYYDNLRLAGAAVKYLLRQAAADAWGVPLTSVTAAHGVCTDSGTGRTLTYGELAPAASLLTPPTNPPLLDPSQFVLIGTSVPRLEIPSKTNGSAVYGADIRLPGMVYASIRRCATLGSTVNTVGTPPAGTTVVNLGDAVVLVAPTWWQAYSVLSTLPITWNTPPSSAQLDTAVITAQAKSLMTTPTGMLVAEQVGNSTKAINTAAKKLNATYDVPYLPHAALESVVCTALVTASSCTIWAPTQVQTAAVATVASLTGLPESAVTVNTTLLGGALGRKLEVDFIAQAVRVAMTMPGTPVMLQWPRREDFAYDAYRPMARTRVLAGLDASNHVVGWSNRIVTPGILLQKGYIPPGTLDDQATEGAVAQPYTWGARLVEWVPHPAGVPVGFWRSVGHSFNAWAVESAMDELALLAGADPVQFRLDHLPAGGRHANVLSAAATLGGWGTAPSGHAKGVALHESFGSIAAMVVEVSQPTAGQIRVHNVSVAVDCGTAVNPEGVRAQIEGGVVHGLNAALFGKVKFNKGVPSPTNYDLFRMMRIKDMPQIDVTIVNSGAALGGIGEPGSPPVAPAVANAWAALTGVRKRSLPMF